MGPSEGPSVADVAGVQGLGLCGCVFLFFSSRRTLAAVGRADLLDDEAVNLYFGLLQERNNRALLACERWASSLGPSLPVCFFCF